MEDGLQVLQETPVPQTSTPPSPAHLIFHSPNGRGLLHHLRDYVDDPHARWSKGLSASSVRGAIEGAGALLAREVEARRRHAARGGELAQVPG